jgi:hypothetical protein
MLRTRFRELNITTGRAAREVVIDAPGSARRKHLLGHGFGQTLAPA